MQKIAKELVTKHGIRDSFYICNISTLQQKIDEWKIYLPKIKPHYAIKCNPNQEIIKHMTRNDFGFDCASKTEIDKVLTLGANPKDVVYAHPCKRTYELEYAVSKSVNLTTFDTLSELEKIKQHAPDMNCLIRLKVDNPTARVQLGLKYGVRRDEYQELLDAAKDMNIKIKGTAFHVGSASKDPMVFKDAIEYSKEVFGYAREKGYTMSILDVGGGFTCHNFQDCAKVLRNSINDNFKDESLNIIAEPGRYFAEDTFTFFVPVIGKRIRDDINEYWIADGLYGSFNCILYDGQIPTFEVLGKEGADMVESVLHMASCDSLDSFGHTKLPNLAVGDFLMIRNFGAYTIAGAMDFNGINMSNPLMFYVNDKSGTA